MDEYKDYRPITKYAWFFLTLEKGRSVYTLVEDGHENSPPSPDAPIKVVIENLEACGWTAGAGTHLNWIWTPLVWEVRWSE